MALGPGSPHQRLHFWCGSCGAMHRWGEHVWRRWEYGGSPCSPGGGFSPPMQYSTGMRRKTEGFFLASTRPKADRLRGIMCKVTKGEPDIIVRKRELLSHCEPVSEFCVILWPFWLKSLFSAGLRFTFCRLCAMSAEIQNAHWWTPSMSMASSS